MSKYISDIAVIKARARPSSSTHTGLGFGSKMTGSAENSLNKPRMGQMSEKKTNVPEGEQFSPGFTAEVSDGYASVSVTGRCDDGSDDILMSAHLAEKSTIASIGKAKLSNL